MKAGLWMIIGACLLFPLPATAVQTLQIVLKDTGHIFWETPIPDTVRSSSVIAIPFTKPGWRSGFQTEADEDSADGGQNPKSGRIGILRPGDRLTGIGSPLSRSFDRLSLLISSRGRVSLFSDQQQIPLSEALPDGTRIEIRVVSGNK